LTGPETSGYSTAVGVNALHLATTSAAAGNTALGYYALASIVTAGYSTAVGVDALQSDTGGSNCAFGYGALIANTTGTENCAFGVNALAAVTTVTSLCAFGGYALNANTSGTSNAAFGFQALYLNTTGSSNSAFGSGCLAAAVTAGSNSAFGAGALQVCTGSSNSAFGQNAGVGVTSGTTNTLIGVGAGSGLTTQSFQTCVGAYTSCGNLGGAVALGVDSSGNGATATISNQIMLGTTNHTVYYYQSNTSLGATASTPTIANTATGVQVNATKDVMLYLTCSLAGTGFTLKIGPTSTPAYTIVSNVAVTIGDCFAVRVPGGWYVSWQATTATFANQQAVTC
jgi:hypothetical protein